MKNILNYLEKQLIDKSEDIINDLELLNDEEYKNNKEIKNRLHNTLKEQQEIFNCITTFNQLIENKL